MNILFTICARAGSKGFKNKNLKRMNGVPLAYYSLAAIKLYQDAHTDQVSVALNTDSRELLATVREQRLFDHIHFVDRKAALAGDTIQKADVIKDTFLEIGGQFDAVIDLDITSPLRRLEDIERIVNLYKNGVDYDLLFSVVPARRSPYFNMVERKLNGFYGKICASDYTARQQAPDSFELNASIYLYSPQFLCGDISKPILDYRCGISVMPDYLVLDIDSERDFILMEYLHRYYCSQDEALNLVYRTARSAANTLT